MGLDYLTALKTRDCIKSEVAELRHWSHVLSDVVSDVWFYTDELTFLPNRKAYNSRERLPVQVWIDVKGLYQINKRFGEACGDEVLWRVGRVLEGSRGIGYRFFADKFVVETDTTHQAQVIACWCRSLLSIEQIPIPGPSDDSPRAPCIEFWWGIGHNLRDAEQVALAAKRRFRST